MSKAISKTALKELAETAGHYCDHLVPEDHEPGYCDYVTVSQEGLQQLLDASA